MNCANCGSVLAGNYCSHCGQSARVGRITFKETLSDFFSASFALEGPLMQTMRLLFVNPGKLIREFLAGRRKSYYKPVAFFIVVSAIYFIVRSVTGYNPVAEQMQEMENPSNRDLSLLKEAGMFMWSNLNNILFLLAFSIGFSLKIFFWKRFQLAEYIVAGFYLSGVYILFGVPLMLWNHYTPYKLPSIHLYFLLVYIIVASISLSQSRSFVTVFKSFLVGLCSLVLYMVMGFGLSFLIVWIG